MDTTARQYHVKRFLPGDPWVKFLSPEQNLRRGAYKSTWPCYNNTPTPRLFGRDLQNTSKAFLHTSQNAIVRRLPIGHGYFCP